jgi:hypothetical protein
VATRAQLDEAGLVDDTGKPPEPWHPIKGPSDASTMWYSVLRKQEKGVFIGALCFRHSDRQASLLESGWDELGLDEIGV